MPLPLPTATPLTAAQIKVRSAMARFGAIGAWAVLVGLWLGCISDDIAGSAAFRYGMASGFLAACLLWIVSILEFTRERPSGHLLIWATLLLSGPVLGPLIFYYRVWRSRYPAAQG